MAARVIFLTAITLLLSFAASTNSAAFVGDLAPDAGLWTTTNGISVEAICYTDPKSVQVTEPEFAAVFRFYISNHSDHVVKWFGATGNLYGFVLHAKGPQGETLIFPGPSHEMSMFSFVLNPGDSRGFTGTMSKGETSFLKDQPLTVSASIYEPMTKKKFKVECPLHFK